MRFVNRSTVEAPAILDGAYTIEYIDLVEKYLTSNSFERPPKPPKHIIYATDVTDTLSQLFKNKCAYCEVPVPSAGYSEGIDHFRPFSGAERKKGDVDSKHYAWLALEWENIYLACPACLRAKRNLFPVKRLGRIGASIANLRRTEGEYIIDPCFEKPERHLFLNAHGYMQPVTEKGEATIDVLNLNRLDLVNARQQVVVNFLDIWNLTLISDEHIVSFLSIFKDSAPYSGSSYLLWEQILHYSHIPKNNRGNPNRIDQVYTARLIRQIGRIDAAYFDTNRLPRHKFKVFDDSDLARFDIKPIRSVNITNFMGINHFEVGFPEPKSKNATMTAILGTNAVGKTCLLKAITLALIGPTNAQEVIADARSCLRRGTDSGGVIVNFWDSDKTNEIFFNSASPQFHGTRNVNVLVLAYGAYRLPARGQLRGHKRGYLYRVHSLFDERELVNGSLGMVAKLRDNKKIRNAAGTLKELLASADTDVELKNNNITIYADGEVHELNDLSSGYKSIVALATDIMDVMYKVWSGVESARGIVIIDELDAHLHPSWRMKIVKALRDAFPMIEFIFSTHDPLTLRGVESDEVVVMNRKADGGLSKAPFVPALEGLFVDQMLTSDLFGLNSTLGVEEDGLFTAYYDLLAKGNLTQEEGRDLNSYRLKLEEKQVLGRTKRERLIFKVIDRELARHQSDPKFNEWNKESIDFLLSLVDEEEAVAND